MGRYRKINLELWAWAGGLVVLACIDPAQAHYSLCPFKALGFRYCPGCGLGHAISYLLHGQLKASWQAHPLGIPALAILLHRIFILLRKEAGRWRRQPASLGNQT